MPANLKLVKQSNHSKPNKTSQCIPIVPLVRDWIKRLEKLYDSSPNRNAKRSRYLVNQIGQMLAPGQVSFLFSEPSTGATLFLNKVLEGYYIDDLPVLMSSPNANWMTLITRLARLYTGVSSLRLNRGDVFQNEFPTIVNFAGNLEYEDVFFTEERDLDSCKIQKEMKLWKNRENKRGIFLFDDYFEMERLDVTRLQDLRHGLEQLAVDCNVPIIANVKVKSMNDLYEDIKPCRNRKRFMQLKNSGLNIFLLRNYFCVDALFFPVEPWGAKKIRISLKFDEATLDLLM